MVGSMSRSDTSRPCRVSWRGMLICVRRHRRLLLLVDGLVGSSWAAVRETYPKRIAVADEARPGIFMVLVPPPIALVLLLEVVVVAVVMNGCGKEGL